jgi:N6-adenosine-specific RNA methylase IME4
VHNVEQHGGAVTSTVADGTMTFASTEAAGIGALHMTRTGLIIAAGVTFEDWNRCGSVLQQLDDGMPWAIGDWWAFGHHHYGKRAALALHPRTGKSRFQTYMNYARVSRAIDSSRRREDLPWSHHEAVAVLDAEDQEQLLGEAARGDWSVSKLRQCVRQRRRQAVLDPGRLPPGKFRVIYADPPWRYDDDHVINASQDNYGRADRHYPTMTIEELCALPVNDLGLADSVLFLWVPSPKLFDAKAVIDAWGFCYKTGMVWDKVKHNYGSYVSMRHEHLLICTRGNCTPDEPTPMFDSVVVEERSATHSQKPDCFRRMIDRLYPIGPRLELFARGDAAGGWTGWGNQALPIADRIPEMSAVPITTSLLDPTTPIRTQDVSEDSWASIRSSL